MKYIQIPEILLPNPAINIEKWAVIACDQFTSQKSYWEKLDSYVGEEKSSLRLIYPECYLAEEMAGTAEKGNKRIKDICETMGDYLSSEVFCRKKGMILTIRTTKYGRKRIGLILAIDLEAYSFEEGKGAIRATEAIVASRIPPRIKIRKDALLELPHALVLIDDKEKTVIEPLYNNRQNLKKVYQGKLNMDGGSIEGYLVENCQNVIAALEKLISPETLRIKYGNDSQFLFAVGDGNHSLATACACWKELKQSLPAEEMDSHPARYCLVEVNNLYDSDLIFEPIHRVLTNCPPYIVEDIKANISGSNKTEIFYNGKSDYISIPPEPIDAIKTLQTYIDKKLVEIPTMNIDYIHGSENTLNIAQKENTLAIFFPAIDKNSLFSYIDKNGVLPRKSFSMGEAEEKRYYMEAKAIR